MLLTGGKYLLLTGTVNVIGIGLLRVLPLANPFCPRHGAQGVLDGASRASLENEFGTYNEDVCMEKILERGEYQLSAVSGSPFP